MRFLSTLLVFLVPAVALAQAPAEKTATLKFLNSLYDPATGAYKVTADGKPSLRACNGAVRATKYLGGELPDKAKTSAFVMSCFDATTGGFAEPGGKPDVAITSIGVMAAVELAVPKEKFAKAMDYLKANAKSFEDVRIGAAAVEAWGVKECPFDLEPWVKIAVDDFNRELIPGAQDGGARKAASIEAMMLRLGKPSPLKKDTVILVYGQLDDGGWRTKAATSSDLETTYRVMRALWLQKRMPIEPRDLRKFIAKCRNADGGYGVKPGEPSTMSGVYYSAIISKWLDDLERK